MLPPSIAVHSTPQDRTTHLVPTRNQNRNPRPCGNCSDSKVRCNVAHPYTKLLCKRCKEDGLNTCPPYVQRNAGKRRAPYRKRNAAPTAEFADASNIVFIQENMPISNTAKVSQEGSGGSGNIAGTSENNVAISSQTATVPSARKFEYSVGYGYGVAFPGGLQAKDIGTVSNSIASTSKAGAYDNEGLNVNDINNEDAVDNELFSYNWLDFVNSAVEWKL
ncbi:hypothetical protein BD410DRAFT_613859 [Rickenella mellea]|uniref:Zn(2)-C6 fungal-type domain-containing protein n=1 Tax=Rickenella mellea TaxID=50990 RepID=A0A4Y7PP19_9AGAM|nr:hypothetical protein BD410DRAFT_613859 [Rickenella mellea]